MSESYRPGWYPDPMGRFAQRYYDGTNWTEHVVDQSGQQSSDALRSADPAPSASSASGASASTSPAAAGATPAASGWGAPPNAGPDPSASSVPAGGGLSGAGAPGPDPGPGPGPVAPGGRPRPAEAAPPSGGWGAPGGATEVPPTPPPVTTASPTPPPVAAPVGPTTTPVPTVTGPSTTYGGPSGASPYATPGNTGMPGWATMPSSTTPATKTATSGPPMVVSLVLVLAGIVAALLSLLVLHWLSDAKFPDIARAVRDSGTDVGFLQNAYYHFGFLIALAAAAVAGLLAVFLGGPLRWVGLAVAVVAGLWHLSVLINRPEAPSGTLSYNFTPWLGLLGFALIAVGSVLVPSRRKEPVDRYPVNQTA